MIKGDSFVIEFSDLSPLNGLSGLDPGPATPCVGNSNHYTSGTQRDTCCCSCDKD